MSSQEEALTIAEIMQEYPEEWVAMKVAERDANGQPLRGIVVGHHRDKHTLREQTVKERELCIFFAGHPQIEVMI